MSNRGIDYSLGRSNFDKDTGIHYGVISQNSVNPDCTTDFEYEYAGPNCPKCGNTVLPSDSPDLKIGTTPHDDGILDWFDGKDFCCTDCEECFWSESVWSDESIGWNYEADGYSLADCLDTDIFVLKSPYYTFSQYCSPCVPGAGNLDTPVDDGIKTYCLGPDWFDTDNPMPYRCYRVSDGTRVRNL